MKKVLLLLVFVYGVSFGQEIDYCSKIQTNTDKFSGIKSFNSPRIERITYFKEKGIISMRIDIPGSSVSVNEKGVLLLLSDGTQIKRPSQNINANYEDGYRYSAYFNLSKAEITRIINNPITDVKLYIYDAEVFNPQKYSEYLKCIVTVK